MNQPQEDIPFLKDTKSHTGNQEGKVYFHFDHNGSQWLTLGYSLNSWIHTVVPLSQTIKKEQGKIIQTYSKVVIKPFLSQTLYLLEVILDELGAKQPRVTELWPLCRWRENGWEISRRGISQR